MKTFTSSLLSLLGYAAICAIVVGAGILIFSLPPAPWIGLLLVLVFVAWIAGWLPKIPR